VVRRTQTRTYGGTRSRVKAFISEAMLDELNDDAVLACAFSAEAAYIVSGDPHLLDLQSVRSVAITSVNVLVEQFSGDLPL
jgi:predicted nucleic acid-binding protein